MNPPEMHSEDDPEFNEPETSTGSGTIQDLLKEIRRRRFQQQASYDQGERADTVSEEIGEQAPPDSGIEAHAEDESYQREVVDDAGGESSPSLEEDSPELSRMESASDARDFQDLLGELRRRSLQQQTLS